MKYCLLLLTLALGACQSTERLASCEGPVFPLNVDRWQPVVKLARRRGASQGRWLERMLARKPPMLVAVALANKMARTVWALRSTAGVYKAPVAAA